MIKLSNHKAVALLVLATAGCSVEVTPKQPDVKSSTTVSTKTTGLLQPPPSLPQVNFQTADPATKAFYAANSWHAAWSSEAAKALDEALGKRSRDGLDRVDFGSIVPHGDAAHVDVQRTRVALTYAAALAHGVTDPTMLHKVYTIPRPDPISAAVWRRRCARERSAPG